MHKLPILLAVVVALPAAAERRCFDFGFEARGSMHVSADGTGALGEVPVPQLPAGSTSAASSADAPLSGGSTSGGGGGSGGLSGEGLLVAAVVVVTALPIVLYSLDSPADEDTLFRHHCPSLKLALQGGAMTGAADPSVMVPTTGARLTFAQGMFGVDASWEQTLDGARTYGAADAHLLLRAPPKKHVELGLALGARRVGFGGALRNGFSAALPHRYAFTRIGTRPLGLEMTPAIFVGNRGMDFRLEGAFVIPAGPVTVLAGGRVYSFDDHVRGAAHVGLSFGY